jgi:hypothetical protein
VRCGGLAVIKIAPIRKHLFSLPERDMTAPL